MEIQFSVIAGKPIAEYIEYLTIAINEKYHQNKHEEVKWLRYLIKELNKYVVIPKSGLTFIVKRDKLQTIKRATKIRYIS